jgi:hypothetical protein
MMLPSRVAEKIKSHLETRRLHRQGPAEGLGRARLSRALVRSTPSTGEVGLAMGVSAQNRRQHPNTGEQGRHHLDPSVIQKAVLRAVLATGVIRLALGSQ